MFNYLSSASSSKLKSHFGTCLYLEFWHWSSLNSSWNDLILAWKVENVSDRAWSSVITRNISWMSLDDSSGITVIIVDCKSWIEIIPSWSFNASYQKCSLVDQFCLTVLWPRSIHFDTKELESHFINYRSISFIQVFENSFKLYILRYSDRFLGQGFPFSWFWLNKKN